MFSKMISFRTLALAAGAAALIGTSSAHGAVRYVKFNAVGANNGTSWNNAYRKLQDALAAVVDGDEVWVAAGTYVPAVPADVDPKDQPFRIRRGAKVYGGFLGNEATRAQRNPAVHVTILSGDINGDDLPGFVNRADNSMSVVSIITELQNPVTTSFRVLDGFTIRGGSAIDPNNQGADSGGGMRLSTTGLPVRVTNCVFRDNDGEMGGALIVVTPSDATNILFTNCLFAGNRANINAVEVQNCQGVRFASCTFAHNKGTQNFSGSFRALNAPNLMLTNCIFWGSEGGPFTGAQSSQLSVTDSPGTQILSCVFPAGPLVGVDCRFTDPCFVDPSGPDGNLGTADDDFRLRSGSLAIDAGNGGLIPNDFGDTDGDGNFFEQVQVDLDRISRVLDDAGITNTGVGLAVDIGAYENSGLSCLGDYSGDGLVNTIDLTRFLGNFGTTSNPCGSIDLNADGVVNTADLVIFLGKFGNNCNI
ncbi:MAG: right-handed parallel beta-helix repeat-containing protein [Phycisphaerales bacterium]